MAGESTNSIREALSKAWEAEESGEPLEHPALKPIDSGLPGDEGGGEEQVVTTEETQEEAPVVVEKQKPKPTQRQFERQPVKQVETKQKPLAKTGTEKTGEQQQPPVKAKAPQSWRPTTRVHWDKLPAEVQEEVTKREREVSTALVQSAAARKFGEEFGTVVRPFEGLLRASGVQNPLQAVNNLMTTAATLQTGTPQQRAGTVANIIKAYGVDIALLDQMLAGQAPKGGNGSGPDPSERILGEIDRRLQPMTKFISQFEANNVRQQQQAQQEASQTYEQFAADPANEFIADLQEDMADLLDMNAKRGRVMTIKQAYDLAAANHPEVSKVLAERKAAERATTGASSIDRARRAAASQSSGAPAAPGGKTSRPKGIRGALNSAWDDLSAQG